ncbi:MAG: hypothetical protein QOI42_706 [Frankiaceae bacterium]|nr:hypothetical protein [Frankiaceae bacterium]
MSEPRPRTTRVLAVVARRRLVRLAAVTVLVSSAAVATLSNQGASAVPPPRTFGPVIEAVTYEPQSTCNPVAKPGVLAFRSFAMRYFGAGDLGITKSCSSPEVSEHKEGRAWDAAYNYYNPTQRAKADRLLNWLLAPDAYGNKAANARRLGIMYMIWHNKIWGAYYLDAGWRDYHGPDPHTNHIHISFTWEGAYKQSTWYDAASTLIDPYQQWADTTAPDDSSGDALAPILTTTPVDTPRTPTKSPVRAAKPTAKPIVHKVYDELHGAVISAEHFTR